MKTTTKKYGANSQAIVIPKAIAELYGIENSQVQFEPQQHELLIRVSVAEKAKSDEGILNDALMDIDQQYGPLFQRLAHK